MGEGSVGAVLAGMEDGAEPLGARIEGAREREAFRLRARRRACPGRERLSPLASTCLPSLRL